MGIFFYMGEFFDYQNPAVLADGVRRLRSNIQNYDPEFISAHAQQFNFEKFKKATSRIKRNKRMRL